VEGELRRRRHAIGGEDLTRRWAVARQQAPAGGLRVGRCWLHGRMAWQQAPAGGAMVFSDDGGGIASLRDM
jgi:hypothetical protein